MAGNIRNYLLIIALTGYIAVITAQTTDFVTEVMTTENVEPNIPTFTAMNDNDEHVCMILALDATIRIETHEGDVITTEVPIYAEIVDRPAECPDTAETSFMELAWDDQDKEFSLYLKFEKMEDKYTMVLINGSMTVVVEGEVTAYVWEQNEDLEIPNVPVGRSVHCKDVTLSSIEFREYKFQPFAQNSGGEFGEVKECSTDDDGMDMMWIIIISVVGGILLIALIGGGVYCVQQRRKAKSYESV